MYIHQRKDRTKFTCDVSSEGVDRGSELVTGSPEPGFWDMMLGDFVEVSACVEDFGARDVSDGF
ncbi:hypothetical protein J2X31_000359 [Flavobacterium arsenatis]|uniref:Uncharacterized protein n=1 Tax=Flavobacterium arsenatis TaxID=1484332 RepID=A0ABU1TKA9_9FLAO|nr:hypothetical protein [Flavobacterium arsenatis]MDR6966366.1 hypothetical protein [Flavobacterium arsenatis]